MVGAGRERGREEKTEDAGMVSLMAEVPEPLLLAMRTFIDDHPNWDQYRLFQAALAGFLVQNGSQDRAVTRCYLANLFPQQGRFAQNEQKASRSPRPRPSLRGTGWQPEAEAA